MMPAARLILPAAAPLVRSSLDDRIARLRADIARARFWPHGARLIDIRTESDLELVSWLSRAVLGGNPVEPGSKTFTASGTWTVPLYNVVTSILWGGGGAGGDSEPEAPTAGGNSSFNAVTAGGGKGGGHDTTNGPGGAGGTASGGDTNTAGEAGEAGHGSSYGGAGGSAPDGGGAGGQRDTTGSGYRNGTAPGGGGSGRKGGQAGGGGGSGARAAKDHASGSLTVGASVVVTVGAGGVPHLAGNGARGEVRLTWI